MSSPPAVRRRATRLGGAAALVAVTCLVGAAPASAHDELVSTLPADGATVDAAGKVVLTFSEPLLPEFNRVVLTGPDGQDVAATVSVDGSTLTGRVPTELAAGGYQVTWRASSGDGHPVSGTWQFTVAAPETPTPSSTTATAQGVVPQAAATPTPSPAGRGDTGLEPGSTSAKVLAVGAALALLTSVVLLWRRRSAQPRG